MTVCMIEKAALVALEPLLRASYGADDFSLEDELAAFDKMRPRDWFVLTDPDPKGFIRYFPLADDLYLGELYAFPGPARAARLRRLLEHFLARHRLPSTARLRLDTPSSDTDLNSLLSQVPNATSKTFAYYQLETPTQPRTSAERSAPFGRRELEQIQSILGILKHYSLAVLEQLDRAGSLVAVRDEDVRAALHVEAKGWGRLEVITLATDTAARRRGYASALLQELLVKHSGATIFLKVETPNEAAIRLYERVGFIRDERKTERWWVLPPGPLS